MTGAGQFLLVGLGISIVFSIPGCILRDCSPMLGIVGSFLDEQSTEPLRNVPVSAFTFTDGRETGGVIAVSASGIVLNSTNDAGDFELSIIEHGLRGCPPIKYTAPDEIEFTVLRSACEVRVRVPVNDQTVIDPDFPDNVLEFRDAILVPPCEE